MRNHCDFFISYNHADEEWAAWIAWQLEAAGYSTVSQVWDFRPGSNFVLEMQRATTAAVRTIAVVSPDFLTSTFAAPEWAAAFAQDPGSTARRLVPVRVRDCRPTGLLGQIVYIDLVGRGHDDARAVLLAGVRDGRAKPTQEPRFPGAVQVATEEPPFPGDHGAAATGTSSRVPPSSVVTANVDVQKLIGRAHALIPPSNRGYPTGRIGVIAAAGPERVIVRPAQLESRELRDRLMQRAMFGDVALFDPSAGGMSHRIVDTALVLTHERATIALDELGSLAVFQLVDAPRPQSGMRGGLDFMVLIEEDIADQLQRALCYTKATLDDLDTVRDLTTIALAAVFLDVGHRAWRTRDEHLASPNSVGLGMDAAERVVVQLSPPVRARDDLDVHLDEITEDLLVKLRRAIRTN